jgi:hypothetical protein
MSDIASIQSGQRGFESLISVPLEEIMGYTTQFVEALHYKLEGYRFNSVMGSLEFFIDLVLADAT